MKCGPARVEGPPSQGPNTMALEDGSGPRASSPRCQTSPSEHRRNQLRTFPKPAHEVRPGAGRGTPLAGPKHHGQKVTFGTVGCWPAGPIRPPGPWCQTGVPRPAPGRTSWAGLGNQFEAGFYGVQKVTGTVGCWPAGPIRPPGPWCLGPARGVPRPAPGRTSWAGLGKVRSWFLRCSEGDVWHRGLLARGPDPSSRAMVFGPCEGGPSTRAGPHFMGCEAYGVQKVTFGTVLGFPRARTKRPFWTRSPFEVP